MKKFAVGMFTVVSLLIPSSALWALDVTVGFNGWTGLAGGYVYGNTLGTVVGPFYGAWSGGFSVTGKPNETYTIDFFHNSGPYGSDFSFTINASGTGVASVTKNYYGFGTEDMVTGFTSGDSTLTLNSKQIILNANGSQNGVYYVYGVFPAYSIGQNSPPQTKTVLPGALSWDNLYNQGLNNEDFQIFVEDDGTVSGVPGYEEYAQFVGDKVYPRAERMHVRLESSSPSLCCVAIGYIHPIENFVSLGLIGGVYVYEWDERVGVGNNGHLFADFGSNTVVASNVMIPTNYVSVATPGASNVGSVRANDYHFRPRVRYDAINDRYYFDSIGGPTTFTYETVTGFFDNQTTPLTMTIYAWIPEPSTTVLAGLGMIALWADRRRTSRSP